MREKPLKARGAGNSKLGQGGPVFKPSILVNRRNTHSHRSALRVLASCAQLMFQTLMPKEGYTLENDQKARMGESSLRRSVSNNAEPAKSAGCSATVITGAVPGTSGGSATVTGLKAPHFTRASARRASEVENNADKAKVKGQTCTGASAPKPQPVLVATRSSGRVIKRPRRDGSPPPSPPKKQDCKQDGHTPDRKPADRKPERKPRGRRQWELWSVEDKQIFFGGLYEFGKDFDAIQNLFAQKHKRKGDQDTVNKTKDQIRHFYYRTWHKIAKYIETNNDAGISKQAMELYGLINYGELRKKIGSKLDDKSGQKLNELIQKGTTVVKVKGRTHRVKTPGCRALKKMNNIDETNKDDDNNRVKIPDHLTIELAPYSNAAWAQVQEMAQNPRIRIKLKSDRKLSNVIEFLNKKWKPNRVRMKDNLEEKESAQQEIKLHLGDKVKVFPVDMEIAPPQPRLDLGLEHYKEYVRTHPVLENSPSGRKGRGGSKSGHHSKSSKVKDANTNKSPTSQPIEVLVKREPDVGDVFTCLQPQPTGNHHIEDNEAVPMETDSETITMDTKPVAVAESCRDDSSLSNDACSKAASGSCDTKLEASVANATVVKSNSVLGAPPSGAPIIAVPSTVSNHTSTKFLIASEVPSTSRSVLDYPAVAGPSSLGNNPPGHELNAPSTSSTADAQNEKVTLLEGGVTRKGAGQFTIAELCLMMGSPEKVRLYYEWVDIVMVPDILQLNLQLTNKLRRLIHLASTEFTDFRKVKPPELMSPDSPYRCSCGRSQAQATTPTVKGGANRKAGRSPATPKAQATTSSITDDLIAPNTPKASHTQAVAAFQSPSAKTIIAAPTVTKGPMSDDGVFPLPVGIPIRPRAINDKTDPLSAINRPDPFVPRRRRLQRNVRRPMLPVQRTLLPKTMPSVTLFPSGSQVATPGSYLAALPSQIPSPAIVSTSPNGSTKGPVKSEMMRPVIRRIVPNPLGTAANALTMSPADIMKRAVIRADLQNVIARNLPPSMASLVATSVAASFSPAAPTATTTNNVTVNGSVNSVEREVTGNGASSATPGIPQSLVKSAIVGEDSFLGVSPQIPTVAPTGQAGAAATNPMGELSLQGGESLSGLSALLDISLPVPVDGDTTDKLLDVTMGENTRTSFLGILDERSKDGGGGTSELRAPSPALSPTKSFRLPGEFQWPGGDSVDYLSQLLESPAKKPVTASASHAATTSTASAAAASAAAPGPTLSQVSILSESSRDSIILGKLDVDSTLQCMLNENSMDYVAKFADLAAQIASAGGDSGSAPSRETAGTTRRANT